MDKVDTTVATMISRSMARLSLAAAAVLIVLSAVAAKPGVDDMDWKEGKLGHLSRFIGTYHYDTVLDDPQVKQALAQTVGNDVGLLKENLAARSPIDFIEGNLVLSGLEPHMGGIEQATLWIRVYDGTVLAAIMHESKVTIYGVGPGESAKGSRYGHLPREFRDFVSDPLRGLNEDFNPPPGVRWVK
jgi:hypothetical protein